MVYNIIYEHQTKNHLFACFYCFTRALVCVYESECCPCVSKTRAYTRKRQRIFLSRFASFLRSVIHAIARLNLRLRDRMIYIIIFASAPTRAYGCVCVSVSKRRGALDHGCAAAAGEGKASLCARGPLGDSDQTFDPFARLQRVSAIKKPPPVPRGRAK